MSKSKPQPVAFATTQQKIVDIYKNNKDLKTSEADLQDLSRALVKMEDKNNDEKIQKTIGTLFMIATSKMESEHDKAVLAGLRQMVGEVDKTLYRPNPRFERALFFPNKANIDILVDHIHLARKTIDLCIFSFTNDDLANAIMYMHT